MTPVTRSPACATAPSRRGGPPGAAAIPPTQRPAELPAAVPDRPGQRALQHRDLRRRAHQARSRDRARPGHGGAAPRVDLVARPRGARVNRYFREQSNVADQRGSIRVQPGSYHVRQQERQIPLTISNGLDQEVIVRACGSQTPPAAGRLTAGPTRSGSARTQGCRCRSPATAVASGQVVVDATLHTRGGTALPPAGAAAGSGSRSTARSRCSSPAVPPACCSWPRACGSFRRGPAPPAPVAAGRATDGEPARPT